MIVLAASQVALVIENLPANAGDIRDMGLIPGSGRSPGGGHGNPLQYSCLESPHGQRSLAGYSAQGHKELGTTEAIQHAHTFAFCNFLSFNFHIGIWKWLILSTFNTFAFPGRIFPFIQIFPSFSFREDPLTFLLGCVQY